MLPDKFTPPQAETDLPLGRARIPANWSLEQQKSKDLFRNLFFGTRSQKGNFKPFPTKW